MTTVMTTVRESRRLACPVGRAGLHFRAPRLRSLWARLRSREMALALLAVVLLATAAGTLVPQSALMASIEYDAWKVANPQGSALAEAIGLTHVYQSWWFLSLLGLLFLSLLACTLSRIRQVWKLDRIRHQQGREIPYWVRMPQNHTAVPALNTEAAFAAAAAALADAGYHVRQDATSGHLVAEKGRFGVWGSTVLHVGIMIILLGGVYSGAGKMAGYFELAEGQAFTDRHDAYLQIDEGPLFGERHPEFQVRLERLEAEHWENGQLRGITSYVTLRSPQGDVHPATLGIDRPLSYQGVTIYQANRYGFAALLTLKDAQGKIVTSGYVNFPTPKEPAGPAFNSFAVPMTSLRAEADLHLASAGTLVSAEVWRQEQPEQPWLYLFLRDADGGIVFQGTLGQGETVPAGAYSLSFSSLAHWAGFPLVRDPGIPIIYAGFALCALGAALIYLLVPKRAWVWLVTGGAGQSLLCIGGRADRFQPAFTEEIQELAAQIGEVYGRP